mmetsp:Transcript_8992/g.16752  ORF Transcript_8992/g.16752 Transcript_8992/m.16752 type:complete len:218 (+) Transcript_8992:230-883(+)
MGHFDFVVFSDSMTFRKGSPGHVLVDDEELGLIFPVADGVKVKPVFSLMAAFSSGAVESPFDAAAILSSDAFQWVSLENKKPNYSSSVDCQCFVAISTFDFAEKLLKEHPQQRNFKFVEQTSQYLDPIQEALGTEFKALLSSMGNSDVDPIYLKAQRWGGAFYSNADSSKDLCFVDRERRLALCGDYCGGSNSNAETAMLSGLCAGEELASLLHEEE